MVANTEIYASFNKTKMKFKPFEIPIRIESLAEAKILKIILEAQGTLFKTIIEDIIEEVEKRNLTIE